MGEPVAVVVVAVEAVAAAAATLPLLFKTPQCNLTQYQL